MYHGEFSSKLDEKGRVSVPRRFRSNMEAFGHVRWYMTRGFDRCIALYYQDSWDDIATQLDARPMMDAKALDFRRLFFGGAAESQVDGQGRLTIPQHLRAYGGLEDDPDAVMIGVIDHLEIWNRSAWEQFQDANLSNIKEMASELFTPVQAVVGGSEGETG